MLEIPTDNISEGLKSTVKKINDLREFARWLAEGVYDVSKHPHFCEERDKLIKEK